MLKILINGKEIKECGKLNISCTKSDVCKKLSLDILKNINVNLGDKIEIENIFYGFVFANSTDDNSIYQSVIAYCPLVYFKKSKLKKTVFENKISNEIINSIISEAGGISIVQNDLPNVKITVNLKDKTLYDGLIEVIKKVKNKSKDEYILRSIARGVGIVKLGFKSSVEIKWNGGVSAGTLLSRKYSESLENMINTVYVLDEKDNLKEVKTSDLTKYGTIATNFKLDKDKEEIAENQFKGIDIKIDISVIGDWSFSIGTKVFVKGVEMYIESESHNYSDGIHLTDLTLIRKWIGDEN